MHSESWLDLILPRSCHGCARPGELMCRRCLQGITGIRPTLTPPPPGGPGLYATGGEHTGVLRAALLVHKQRRHRPTVRVLSALLGRALAVLADVAAALGRWRPPVVLVPMPSSSRRPWRVPILELLMPLVRCLPDVRVAPALVAVRSRPPQKGLDASERARNVEGAFAFRRRCGGEPPATVVVVDDVVTTGASMAAATRVLDQHSWCPTAALSLTSAAVVGR